MQQLLLDGGRVLGGFGVPGCYFLCPNIRHVYIYVHVAPALLTYDASGCVLFVIAVQQCWVFKRGRTLCGCAHLLPAFWAPCPIPAPSLIACAAQAHVHVGRVDVV